MNSSNLIWLNTSVLDKITKIIYGFKIAFVTIFWVVKPIRQIEVSIILLKDRLAPEEERKQSNTATLQLSANEEFIGHVLNFQSLGVICSSLS